MSVIERAPVIANTAGISLICGLREFSLDVKGRLVLPREWMGRLGLPFVLVPTADGRLFAMNIRRWEQSLRHLGSHPLHKDALQAESELICTVDATTGRFLIPWTLRERAGLKTKSLVRLLGRGDCFEIISRERWLREQAEVRA